MKKLAYILLLSLPFLETGCGQKPGSDTAEGHGAQNPQYQDDSQTGAGRVEESGMGTDASNDGGTMTNTTSTGDTMTTPEAVGASDAARATKKTRTQSGTSQTKGKPAGAGQENK